MWGTKNAYGILLSRLRTTGDISHYGINLHGFRIFSPQVDITQVKSRWCPQKGRKNTLDSREQCSFALWANQAVNTSRKSNFLGFFQFVRDESSKDNIGKLYESIRFREVKCRTLPGCLTKCKTIWRLPSENIIFIHPLYENLLIFQAFL